MYQLIDPLSQPIYYNEEDNKLYLYRESFGWFTIFINGDPGVFRTVQYNTYVFNYNEIEKMIYIGEL
jgi:hypothetical protein